eukprot:TCONS_00001218-protein
MAERFYVRGNMPRTAVEMYTKVNKYEAAYKLAVRCMDSDDVSKLYIAQAEQLEAQGRFKEAEKLYIMIEEGDLAINMYKRAKMYDQMIKLVKEYHGDLITDTHLHLAKELESEGQLSTAEHHYLEVGDWKACVNMYRSNELWEDAYRIAKQSGTPGSGKQVAYLWAKSLGGDSAIKLLQKLGLLEACIDYAIDTTSFDFAFDLARTLKREKVMEIHLKKAMFLEDEGRFNDAEDEFIKAEKPKEAVLMYIHQSDWDEARRVAESYDPESLVDVLIGQARLSFEKKDYTEGESFLLRAQRPELAIKFYKECQRWPDVLRIAKEYVPHQLAALQDEYDRIATQSGGDKGAEGIIAQARDWETRAEYNRAIDLYMRITQDMAGNSAVIEEVYTKALELAIKFSKDRALSVAHEVCKRLLEMQAYETASDLYQAVKLYREAISACVKGDLWTQARSIARDYAPKYEEHVEEEYVKYLKKKNKTDELINVDVIAALDMYVEQGLWDKCIQEAEQQSFEVLSKYVALYAANLIKDGDQVKALRLFVEHGAPANPQNFNIYKRLVEDLFAKQGLSGENAYKVWADLRTMLYDLCDGFNKKPTNPAVMDIFNRMLLVAHYYAIRSAITKNSQLEVLHAKISVSLLRYCDLIPCDKAFYEAGIHCKGVGWENMAFVFLNRYLDLSEGIEDGNLDAIDNTDIMDTDIPLEVPLPETQYLNEEQREEVKEWVLAVSMDQRVEQTLSFDERNVYEASLTSPESDVVCLPCVVTGYPVLRNKMEFNKTGKAANKEDWNKFAMATKVSHSADCQDVLRFLSLWCGTSGNQAFSFG